MKSESTSTSEMESKDAKGVELMTRFNDVMKTWYSFPSSLPVYDSRPSDVIVSTFPKSGTTLIQYMAYEIVQLYHGLNNNCDNYTDLNEMAPWIDQTITTKTPIPDGPDPRVLKTHSARTVFEDIGKTEQRHIAVIREPVAAMKSWLNFLYEPLVRKVREIDNNKIDTNDDGVKEAVFHLHTRRRLLGIEVNEPDIDYTDDEEEKDKERLQGDNVNPYGTWFDHVKSWVCPARDNILVLFYEDVIRDMHGTVRKVGEFMGCALNETQVGKIAGMCARERMAGDKRFDMISENLVYGLWMHASKAVGKDVVDFKKFETRAVLRKGIERLMGTTFGVKTYDELREKINREQAEKGAPAAPVEGGGE